MYIECLPSKCPCRFVVLSMLSLHKNDQCRGAIGWVSRLAQLELHSDGSESSCDSSAESIKANSFVGGPTGYINASCCWKFRKWFHLNDHRIAPSSLWYDPDYWRFIHSLMTCARHQSDWNDSKIYTPAEWKNSYSYEQCSWAVSGKTLRDKNHKKYLTACWATSFICLTKFSAGPLLSPLLISTSSRIRRLWISNYTRCSGKIWHTLPKMSVAHAVGTTFELM